jgi:hypothetical protein
LSCFLSHGRLRCSAATGAAKQRNRSAQAPQRVVCNIAARAGSLFRGGCCSAGIR